MPKLNLEVCTEMNIEYVIQPGFFDNHIDNPIWHLFLRIPISIPFYLKSRDWSSDSNSTRVITLFNGQPCQNNSSNVESDRPGEVDPYSPTAAIELLPD